MSSLKIDSNSIFDGILYNLDAETIPHSYQFEDDTELYEFYENIGEGAFSTVHRVMFLPTGQEMALKVIKEDKLTTTIMNMTKLEAQQLNKLDHPNILKVHHLIKLNGKLYMGMEYLPGGSLHDLIKNRFAKRKRFSDRESSIIMKGILEAVNYIHCKNIIHRDLKPANIMI